MVSNTNILNKYLLDKSTDNRMLVLLGYTLLENAIKSLIQTNSIDCFEKKLSSSSLVYVSHAKPSELINYFRKLRNSIAHNYFSKDQFDILLKNHQFLPKSYWNEEEIFFETYKFTTDYSSRDFSNKEELILVFLDLLEIIDELKYELDFKNNQTTSF